MGLTNARMDAASTSTSPAQHTRLRLTDIVQWTPKQTEAWESLFTHRFILYGGARGGGKSFWLRWSLVFLLIFWHKAKGRKNVTVALFCEDYPTLRDRQITKISTEFPSWLGEIKETQEDGLCFFLRERFGAGKIALRNLDDPSKYKSAEFAAVAMDELTQQPTAEAWNILRGSMRWKGISRTVFLAATNPDGPGNLWVREIWVEHQFPPELQPAAREFKFIKALPTDNPHLDQQYWQDLLTQPEDVRKAWIEGDWYVFSGQAFRQFRQATHIIQPQEIPAHWWRYRGIDWGSTAPFVCLWGAMNPDNGQWIVYREAAETGLTDREQARMVLDYTPPDERIRATYADPSMFYSPKKEVVPSATIYSQNGLAIIPGANDRLDGKRRIDRLLGPLDNGEPGVKIFLTCVYLTRTLPALTRDKINPEDVDSKGPDHAYDALRYLTTPASDYLKARAEQIARARNQQPPPIYALFDRSRTNGR